MITWLKVALVIFTAVLLQVTVVANLPIADVRGDIFRSSRTTESQA